MGGKGGAAPPPAGEDNSSMMMEALIKMMGGITEAANAPEEPDIPDAPEIDTVAKIDWKEKQDQLAAKMKAQYATDDKKGAGTDTIHTSPLLDEEDTTSQSLMAGKTPKEVAASGITGTMVVP